LKAPGEAAEKIVKINQTVVKIYRFKKEEHAVKLKKGKETKSKKNDRTNRLSPQPSKARPLDILQTHPSWYFFEPYLKTFWSFSQQSALVKSSDRTRN